MSRANGVAQKAVKQAHCEAEAAQRSAFPQQTAGGGDNRRSTECCHHLALRGTYAHYEDAPRMDSWQPLTCDERLQRASSAATSDQNVSLRCMRLRRWPGPIGHESAMMEAPIRQPQPSAHGMGGRETRAWNCESDQA